MAKGSERTLLVATESFHSAMPDGSTFLVRKGQTIVWSDHPAAKKNPAWFKPVEPTHETPGYVESATAAPGEKRGS